MEVRLLFLESYSQASYFTKKNYLFALNYVPYPNNYFEKWFEGKNFNEYFFQYLPFFCHYFVILFSNLLTLKTLISSFGCMNPTLIYYE